MVVQYREIVVRSSRGEGNANQAPLEVRMLALRLEAAEPRFLYYADGFTADQAHVLLLQAALQKANAVESEFTWEPQAQPGVKYGHEITPGNPGTWNPIGGGTRSIIYPIVGRGVTYYIGFSIT